ncbi:AmiR/NasT family two-component response regulator [Angulomicrobium tetraedrale]|uniref:AmiR/NasT family two-component response regulator n=1 Tax=Ancylobacter tetraedralis TaxID=217068 RepID=A0A839ZCX2_9HYPH|nr:ANTAR domain-containing protein [Ancylobacter tetraedralis]MBB3772547.1 AmiR/NasT family two-component response regulator [Ancylobacter tetraedralis]
MRTPNLVGRRALVLHRPDEAIARLERQLRLIGLEVEQRWTPMRPGEAPDIVLVDADQGWNGLLAWEPGAAATPVIALLGSEAPGRIAWAIDQGAGAIIAKPVAAAAVYPALVLALHAFEQRVVAQQKIAALGERLRLRAIVARAVEAIALAQQGGEDAAYRQLRDFAMRRRLTLEQAAAAILARQHILPEVG